MCLPRCGTKCSKILVVSAEIFFETSKEKMKKPLAKLGAEYLDSAAKLSERIAELKSDFKNAKGAHRADLANRINMLYKDARNARLVGLYLNNYYEKGAAYVREE